MQVAVVLPDQMDAVRIAAHETHPFDCVQGRGRLCDAAGSKLAAYALNDVQLRTASIITQHHVTRVQVAARQRKDAAGKICNVQSGHHVGAIAANRKRNVVWPLPRLPKPLQEPCRTFPVAIQHARAHHVRAHEARLVPLHEEVLALPHMLRLRHCGPQRRIGARVRDARMLQTSCSARRLRM